MHSYIHTFINTYIHTYIHAYIVHTYMHTYIHTHTCQEHSQEIILEVGLRGRVFFIDFVRISTCKQFQAFITETDSFGGLNPETPLNMPTTCI